jgi:hypothetical protein
MNSDCGTSQQCCGSTCYSLFDNNNCGGCGISCTSGKNPETCCDVLGTPTCSPACSVGPGPN